MEFHESDLFISSCEGVQVLFCKVATSKHIKLGVELAGLTPKDLKWQEE